MATEITWRVEEGDALDQIELPGPGVVQRGRLRFSHPMLADWAWPYTAIRGGTEGPRLALISGVHPAEYPAIEANIRVTRDLNPMLLSGSIVSVPVVDFPAFYPRTPFVCPIDNKNPNRFFPGNPNGTFTDVMDDAIFRAVIAPADYLLDLHGGDMVEALVPFAIYSVSGNEPVDKASAGLGQVFGLPYLIAQTSHSGGPSGTSVQAAAAAGIPGLIAEAGGCGLLTQADADLLRTGVHNVLHQLNMLEGPPGIVPSPVEITQFTWLTSPAEGMWYPAVVTNQEVQKGQVIGRIGDLWGATLAEVVAPHPGHVLFITTAAAMKENGLLLAIGE